MDKIDKLEKVIKKSSKVFKALTELYKFDYQNTNANKLNLIDYAFYSKLLKFISDLSIHFISLSK